MFDNKGVPGMITVLNVEDAKRYAEASGDDKVKDEIYSVLKMIDDGEKVQLRHKESASGEFIAIYLYDKVLYRYVLTKKIKIK